MRLGGPVFEEYHDPAGWVRAVKKEGYRAAYCPVKHDADQATVDAYARAAAENGILIAEVGAWSNPISPDARQREEAVAYCKQQLDLADRIGARCCVNIAGSRGDIWDGPHPANFTDDTFALIVDTVRAIIDDVKPTRTHYALETMPWIFPDGPDTYLNLLKAIDRKQLAVHLDPVNMISSPRRYFDTTAFIKECFAKLGPYIKNCHAKDVRLGAKLTVHLDEVVPGQGALDYRTLLSELSRIDPDTPILVEHLHSEEQYRQALTYIRHTAGEIGVTL